MNAASYNHLQFLSCTLQSYSEPKGNTFQVRPWCFLSFMFFWLNSKHVFFRNEKILCSVEKTLCILTQPPFKAFRTTSHPAKANKQSFPTHGAQDIKKIHKNTENQRSPSKLMQGLVKWNRGIEEQVGQDTVFSMLGPSQTTAAVFKTCCNSESRPGRSYISNRNN